MKEVAEDYITQFLPPKIVQGLHLQTLTLDNTTYTTSDLSEYFADVVWHCVYGKKKEPLKTVFLFEHKSFVPQYPHVQILRYMLEIWEMAIKNKESLPLVIPIVVYHSKSKKRWVKKPFEKYFKDVDENLRGFIPTFDYQLTDLNTMDEETAMNLKVGLLLHTFMTLKYGSDKSYILSNLEKLIVRIAGDAKNERILNFLRAQLVYIIKNTEFSRMDVKLIFDKISKSANMTTYDLLYQEAVESGIEKGIEKGIEIQSHKKNVDFTTSLIISTDFDNEKIATLVGVEITFVAQIRADLKAS